MGLTLNIVYSREKALDNHLQARYKVAHALLSKIEVHQKIIDQVYLQS